MGVDVPRLPRAYPSTRTRDTGNLPSGLRLRGYHPLWRSFPAHFGSPGEGVPRSIALHIPCNSSLQGSVWAVPVSVAPTPGIAFCFLFLPLLRCFNSGGSRSLPRACAEAHTRSHSGISGSKAPCASPELIAAWHALRRLGSPAIHHLGQATRTLCLPPVLSHHFKGSNSVILIINHKVFTLS